MPHDDPSDARGLPRTTVFFALVASLAACRSSRAASDSPMTAPHLVESQNLHATQGLGFDEATALQDKLDDGMIDTMVRYRDDCDLMAEKLDDYLTRHRPEYDLMEESLKRIPWPARELPPDKLQRRLEKADEQVRKMAPASEACRTNTKAIHVMGSHFYEDTWERRRPQAPR